MWGPFLLISVFTFFPSALWKAAALPVLPASSSLRTGNVSHKSVMLEWNFRAPEGLKLFDILFFVSLDTELPHERREHCLRYENTTLSFTFQDLVPGKVYFASVVATCPDWLDSPPSQISFTTLEKDWSTPIINSVTKTPRLDIAQYSVRWSELPSSGLSHVVVEVCDSACASYTQDATAVSTPVTLEFGSKFWIRVCALYTADVVGSIKRCSHHFQGNSARAPPEKLLSMKNVRKRGNRVQLDWHPALPSDGPRSYYEIYARDPNVQLPKPVEQPEPNTEGEHDYEISLAVSARTDNNFELEFIDERKELWLPKSIDSPVYTEFSTYERSKQDEPLQLKILMKTRNRFHFTILFRTDVNQSSWFDMRTPPQNMLLGANNFTFSAFKPVEFLVRTCLTYNDVSNGLCGNITASKIINCVRAPSPVSSAGYEYKNANELEIFWEEPKEPRGPIDGYELRILETKRRNTETVILDPHQRSYRVMDETGKAEYYISINAFNWDIDCRKPGNRKISGMSVHFYAIRPRTYEMMVLSGIVVCAVALIIELVLVWWRDLDQDQVQAFAEAKRDLISFLKSCLNWYANLFRAVFRVIVHKIKTRRSP